MSRPYRRFELLIPLRFNDGRAVPDALIADTLLELRRKFGAVSAESQIIHGHWQHMGEVYRDDLVRVFVDVEDQPDTRQFFLDLKEELKRRFQQVEIWMTSHPLDIL